MQIKKIDKRIINMDNRLQNIFPNLNEDLQFTNIMKYIGQHFTDIPPQVQETSSE